MEGSNGVGFMAVFAVSGSVAFVAHQLHKRLMNDFMQKVESEFSAAGVEKYKPKRKVRFADDVLEPSSNNKEYRQRRLKAPASVVTVAAQEMENMPNMPANRRALYEGVIKYRALKGHTSLQFSY